MSPQERANEGGEAMVCPWCRGTRVEELQMHDEAWAACPDCKRSTTSVNWQFAVMLGELLERPSHDALTPLRELELCVADLTAYALHAYDGNTESNRQRVKSALQKVAAAIKPAAPVPRVSADRDGGRE